MKNSPFTQALEIAGGQVALAEKTGYSQNLMSLIQLGKRKISAEVSVAVEKATGVMRHQLRPDLFPQPQSNQDAQQ
jgi:DNA-binding transcriptional regulator YdaS (Cro superfamily)